MGKIEKPVVYRLRYNQDDLNSMIFEDEKSKEYILDYPTIYIINDEEAKKFDVYVGETSDIKQRTLQHLKTDSKSRSDWKKLSESDNAEMYVIGHEHFNKSLTLDIENKMMLYLSGVPDVKKLYNRRTNAQNKYYTSDEVDDIFSKIWLSLRKENQELFPTERLVRDSALFKASPFHKLTNEQNTVKQTILGKITEALKFNKTGNLILVEGEAGSGKTVLLSSLFYEINELNNGDTKRNNNYLLVNHAEQLKVYADIANKLGLLKDKKSDNVSKPTHFINTHSTDNKADIVLIDEAHLLLTQGKQSYQGQNQLSDILERSKVTIAVFDRNQILNTEQYWEENQLRGYEQQALESNSLLYLNNQLRINADQETVSWIRNMIDNQTICDLPKDKKGYDLKIFDNLPKMYDAILEKSNTDNSSLSRMVATFDWEYNGNKAPENSDYWYVSEGDFLLPWNLQLPLKANRNMKNKSWAEQPQTIGEVGSTFTIQGFDLNYVGVIIGPSVKYRDGKIIFDKDASRNKKATRNRTLQDKTKGNFAEKFIQNELNVLLTRGVSGLYIYAVDQELRHALLQAQKGVFY